MALETYLDILASQFPSSQWDVKTNEICEGAVLSMDPLEVKVILFTKKHKQFKKGDVTLSLHAGNHLLQMFGSPYITANGKATHVCKTTVQFEQAATALCDELLGMATAILTVTEEPASSVTVDVEEEPSQPDPEAVLEALGAAIRLGAEAIR